MITRSLVAFILIVLLIGLGVILEENRAEQWEPDEIITWTMADSPVVINESIEIDETTRLVIEPGVEVRLDHTMGILVIGHLQVRGTSDEPVIFTANDTGLLGPDSWESIRLVTESEDLVHQVEHAVFEGARTGLQISSSSAFVQDCSFTTNRYGMVVRGESSVEVRGCDFFNNSALGLEWEQNASGLAVDCSFIENVVGVYWYKTSDPVDEHGLVSSALKQVGLGCELVKTCSIIRGLEINSCQIE